MGIKLSKTIKLIAVAVIIFGVGFYINKRIPRGVPLKKESVPSSFQVKNEQFNLYLNIESEGAWQGCMFDFKLNDIFYSLIVREDSLVVLLSRYQPNFINKYHIEGVSEDYDALFLWIEQNREYYTSILVKHAFKLKNTAPVSFYLKNYDDEIYRTDINCENYNNSANEELLEIMLGIANKVALNDACIKDLMVNYEE